ncbi:acyl-CoA dehydrogenase family protein [Flavisphingomonas formosensis]|uniref:acyl-CoA dehydrogenase family protein n=1 Tax=Flavisphingomonas formosensis TaxID=861534 RepID=UPI0012F91FFE|nr:acyl-CoA dehydrogenase family protein [Sphingomonas formosensis]
MPLVLTEDEQMLVESLRSLLSRSAPVAAFRALRDSGDPKRYSPALWAELAEAGFAAPQVPEAEGGIGMGYAAAGLAAEEMGRVLAATPFLSTALAIELLIAAGDAGQKAALLPGLLDGSRLFALAIEEGGRHDPDTRATRATRDGAGWRIEGTKRFVLDGGVADGLIVATQGEDGPMLLLVDPGAPGVAVTPRASIDSRNAADIAFEGVSVGADAVLGGANGSADDAAAAIARALDVGRVLLAAELLGIAQEAFDRTVAYLKEREQFGVKIGTFQALQHRAARQYVALDLARSVVLKALRALDEGDKARSALASLAKAVTTRTAREAMNEAVQMHGGVGVTDEFDIGLFFKRARVAGETLGDDYFHRERLAKMVWGI